MPDLLTFPSLYPTAKMALTARITELEQRAHKRLMTPVELAEKRDAVRSLAEVEALQRARVRSESELPRVVPAITAASLPLRLVWLQMQELEAAGLTLDCLNTEDVMLVRAANFPLDTVNVPS